MSSAEAACVHIVQDRNCVSRQHAVAIAFYFATLTFSLVAVTPVEAAQKFQKLSGAQVAAKIAGMEITDEVHWGDVFERNGTLISYSMGHKSVGKWRVVNDQLCIDRGKDDGGCYQVWMSGKQIELRREGSTLPLEGVEATLFVSIATGTAQSSLAEASAYCQNLRQLTQLAITASQFGTIAGTPREGNFRDTTLPLTGWKDCALYGATTYTCDSHALTTSQEAEEALTKTTDEILRCLAGAWVQIKDRSSPSYVVLHPARGSASMTLNLDEADNKGYLVRFTLFLRRPGA